jgi:hypothetical protein
MVNCGFNFVCGWSYPGKSKAWHSGLTVCCALVILTIMSRTGLLLLSTALDLLGRGLSCMEGQPG